MSDLVPLGAARARVLAKVAALSPVDVAIDDAVGLALAEDVMAPESVPAFASSAMDGYALRSVDANTVPVRLRVVATTMAGDPPAAPLEAGEAVRIMTGAPLPVGADAVCMVEDSEASADGAFVEVRKEVSPGQHVRRPGEDVAEGALLFAAKTVLTPRHIGVLASVGLARVRCHRRPIVGVLSTGNELRPAGVRLGPGEIRESNRHLLLALLTEAGARSVDLGLVVDDEDLLVEHAAEASLGCDVVVTSGGVSVGDRDIVRSALERLCPLDREVVRVAIKPAKPLVHGTFASGARLVGLPGNPVSSLVSFECFVRPLLAALAGAPETEPALLQAVAAEDFVRRRDGKLHLVGAAISSGEDGRLLVRRVAAEGSHQQRSVAEADVLVHLPDGEGVQAGAVVSVQPIGRFAGFGATAGLREGHVLAAAEGADDEGCC
jgi:molybdopterin molybdotransferase